MSSKRKKFVRFRDRRSELSSLSIQQYDSFYDELEKGETKSSLSHGSHGSKNKIFAIRWNVLDPQGPVLQRWNKIVMIICVLAISVDPLFFYIPVIDAKRKCLDLDGTLKITLSVLRTLFDLLYLLRIIFQFRTGFIAPSSHVFGMGELVKDSFAIAKRYLCSHFIIDILSIIPLPQMVILSIIRIPNCSVPYTAKDLLKYTIIIQYVPRLLRIYPLLKEVTSTSGILTETAWAGAAYNLFLYMLASHVVGALWYLFSIESQLRCWRRQLKNAGFSNDSYLSCGRINSTVLSLLDNSTSCPYTDPDDIIDPTFFNFGMFIDALKSRVVESTTNFHDKFIYCFWWGLRNVSSIGSNLKTGTYFGELVFAIFIAIFGLILFASLIGNMQRYLKSTTASVEEIMRTKRRHLERWMHKRMLPDLLKGRIRRYEQYKWQQNRDVEEEALIQNLPKDLRRDIKHHLCLALLRRVPMFENMDEWLLDALCDRLKPVLYTEKIYVVHEGDPVDEMLFIMRGKLTTSTTDGGRSGFFNSFVLVAGDFCGEELLTWALDPKSSSTLPASTRTVETISEVEAFALMADDLKFVASQFRRFHSKQILHTFRFYSMQWRTWAACYIQVAWRRYCEKKTRRSLEEAEKKPQALGNEDGSSTSFVSTIYALRFASNALRLLRRRKRNRLLQTHRSLTLPQKPIEPDSILRRTSSNRMF